MKELTKKWKRTVGFHERIDKEEPASFMKELAKNRRVP
jgi:hypothetical protein